MPQQKEMPQRPNILFIVADDLGYADLGCYGGRDAAFGPVSPVLDRLAAGGLKLTQGYSNSPVCSPTRFALMTARYQYRLRGAAEEPIRTATRGNDRLGLPPAHPTLPSLLKDAGYRTALMGKWHLGYPPHFSPLKSGYEEFFGPMSGGVDYFTHCGANGTHDLWFGEEEKAQEGYLTDLITDHSVDYIARMAAGAQQGTPFFLSVHYTAPTGPGKPATTRPWPTNCATASRPSTTWPAATWKPTAAWSTTWTRASAASWTRCAPTVWSATPSSSSPATTAANASPTTGPWSAARWT